MSSKGNDLVHGANIFTFGKYINEAQMEDSHSCLCGFFFSVVFMLFYLYMLVYGILKRHFHQQEANKLVTLLLCIYFKISLYSTLSYILSETIR